MDKSMNELVISKNIEDMIYEVRGHYVMLDADLSKLFGYETKRINEAIKNNLTLFTEKDVFKVDENTLRSILTTSNERGGRRYLPYAFTMEGIKILSTILRKQAVPTVTLEIEEAFKNIERKNNKALAIPVSKGERVENLIYNIRGKQVMLDFDLARIYECKNGTKTINLAVKRHQNMFKNDIYFQLSENEFYCSRFQAETLNTKKDNRGSNVKYLPYAFTEEAVYKLATIIRTPVAEMVTESIIKAFISMRNYIGDSLIEQKYINNQVLDNTKKIDDLGKRFEELKNAFSEVQNNKPLTYFKGQIFDAYFKILEIMSEAKKELIVIDRYADLNVLEMISKVKCKVILITGKTGKLKSLDIEKYNSNYNNLTIIYDDAMHDRYLILDESIIYHLGSSINHAGVRTFSINKWEDEVIIKLFLNEINKIIK